MSEMRHSRTQLLTGVGSNGLMRQLHTRVALVGCGGVGQAAAAALAAAGVGALHLIDADTLSATNLGRLPLMYPAAVGKPKAQALQEALMRHNPGQPLQHTVTALTASTIEAVLAATDLVLDATDNWPTRKLLAGYCRTHNLPLISGGALATDGWLGVFLPNGPSLETWLGQPQQLADSCERVGVLGPLVGLIGNWMAMETLKLIWQPEAPHVWVGLQGKILYLDGRYGEVRLQPLTAA